MYSIRSFPWAQAFAQTGSVPYQSLSFIQAYTQAYPDQQVEIVELVDVGTRLASAFVIDGRLGRCLLQGSPFLCLGHPSPQACENLFNRIIRQLGVDALFFPLVYMGDPFADSFQSVPGLLLGQRLPSPTIDWTWGGDDFWDRATLRLGKRASKREHAFLRSGLRCRMVEPHQAVEAVASIEANSWKARAGQDMFSRGQFAFYKLLLLSGEIRTVVAEDGSIPVAYRLDCVVGDRLYCIKWSYHDAYRACSPGFYLIGRDLPARYRYTQLKEVDLFGSPDTLKDAVMSGSRPRCDLGWPAGSIATHEIARNQAHDASIRNHVLSRKGLRYLYAPIQAR
jgi:hypothetical protein